MFEIKDVDLAGRIGVLYTRSGRVETPAFFPVVDPLRQELSPSDIREAGFGQVITNAYLALKRFGDEAVEAGIHAILGFDGVVMTDSGAYQILEYGGVDVSQEEVVRYQAAIGSDIGVILDIPTGDVDHERARITVEETLDRARRAASMIRDTETLWVLPVQGGRHLDLVKYSAMESARIQGYSIYGIGSPTVYLEKYMYKTVTDIIYTAKSILPGGKPVHLFGAGHPLIIQLAIALGVDMFDSASYILYARDDRYITDYGVERLENLEYFPCSCPVCSRYTPQDLREMDKRERTRLLALHNLYKIREAISRAKLYIREGRLWELVEEAAAKHPRAYEVLQGFERNYLGLLNASTPRVKGVVRGIRLYTATSIHNPKVSYFRRRVEEVLEHLARGEDRAIFKPFKDECRGGGEGYIIYYKPYIGVIPWQLCGVYPTIQSHHPEIPPKEVIADLANTIKRTIDLLSKAGIKDITIIHDDNLPWSLEVKKHVKSNTRSYNNHV